MNKVISALERQLQIEEMKRVANKITKDSMMQLPGYKGQPLHIVDEDFISQLREAIIVLKKDESKQPQPPDFANTMLGEVPPVVNDGTEENQRAVEGATPVVRQNEQIQKVCFNRSCYFERNGLCKHMISVYETCGQKQTE